MDNNVKTFFDKKAGHGLPARSAEILRAIVSEYIETVTPVGSRTVAVRSGLELSPASIRAIMAELEEGGYLSSRNKSAGRIPTEKGFRLYVDMLKQPGEPSSSQKELICSAVLGSRTAADTAGRMATRALSGLTGCAAVILSGGLTTDAIKNIKLVKVDDSSLVVMIVTTAGFVHSRLVKMDIRRLNMEKMSNYLNSIAGGLTLDALKRRVMEEMKTEKALYDELMLGALKAGEAALNGMDTPPRDLVIEGASNIIDQPEFKENAESMRRIFAAFEEKSVILKILDKSAGQHGTCIFIGSECEAEGFGGFSLIAAPYESHIFGGAIGVIGPVRMDYSSIIPLVGYTAEILGKAV
ncbi:MAG: heat-inducible transcriptional repressor HrcA [Deltaproteobacteria bacterium]|nr:heat-inducible transcriptional repressor HrcA [Deltaproteobacteria bacterium]